MSLPRLLILAHHQTLAEGIPHPIAMLSRIRNRRVITKGVKRFRANGPRRLWRAYSAEVRACRSIMNDNLLTPRYAGRKLKCDGMRPKCKNCRERHLICEYPANVKRRGPGKAPKGSRSRKRGPMISASASKSGKGRPSTRVGGKGKARKQGGHEEAPVRVLDSEGLAPEVRPFTSVLNLWTLEPQMLHAQQIVGEGTRSRATGLEA